MNFQHFELAAIVTLAKALDGQYKKKKARLSAGLNISLDDEGGHTPAFSKPLPSYIVALMPPSISSLQELLIAFLPGRDTGSARRHFRTTLCNLPASHGQRPGKGSRAL